MQCRERLGTGMPILCRRICRISLRLRIWLNGRVELKGRIDEVNIK